MYDSFVTFFFGSGATPSSAEMTFAVCFFFLGFHLLCNLICGLIKAVR